MTSEHEPGLTQPSPFDALLEERDTLRDEVEGLKSAVDTVMRALKIALKEHNAARMREAVLIDLLRQSESESSEARALLRRSQPLLAARDSETLRLVREIEASLLLAGEEFLADEDAAD